MKDILDFWFADGPNTPHEAWFKKNPDFDAEIAQRFGALVVPAREGALDSWADTPEGALALMILLDQFPRNLFRGSSEAFASDAHALSLARRLVIVQRVDLALTPTQRVFLYLPFEHAESMEAQNLSVALFEGLRDSPAHAAPGKSIVYAWAHRAVIARFGRFPHRNPLLGRTTTAEERAYLDGGGFAG
jgi:uncharacterized protein (DUF924 family)